ncbi:MAG: hypothetical protein LRZ92_00945, partial [Methanosarcinaceae archaeon]|nr:hypothetical protein [Methanosarcinaceae archaeon]
MKSINKVAEVARGLLIGDLKEGFASISGELAGFRIALESINGRLGGIESRLSAVENNVMNLNVKIDETNKRIDETNREIQSTKMEF